MGHPKKHDAKQNVVYSSMTFIICHLLAFLFYVSPLHQSSRRPHFPFSSPSIHLCKTLPARFTPWASELKYSVPFALGMSSSIWLSPVASAVLDEENSNYISERAYQKESIAEEYPKDDDKDFIKAWGASVQRFRHLITNALRRKGFSPKEIQRHLDSTHQSGASFYSLFSASSKRPTEEEEDGEEGEEGEGGERVTGKLRREKEQVLVSSLSGNQKHKVSRFGLPSQDASKRDLEEETRYGTDEESIQRFRQNRFLKDPWIHHRSSRQRRLRTDGVNGGVQNSTSSPLLSFPNPTSPPPMFPPPLSPPITNTTLQAASLDNTQPGSSSTPSPSQSGSSGSTPSSSSTFASSSGSAATTCYVVLRDYPTRQCILWEDDCRAANISESDSCWLCQKGWGTYDTLDDCLTGSGLQAASSGIDPTTYPSPPLPSMPCSYTPSKVSRTLSPSPNGSCPHLFNNLQLWESSSTWGSSGVPASGSSVIIPANTNVLITGCSFNPSQNTNVFKSITIPSSSQLIFDDAPINLYVGTLSVQGRLRIGDPSCRLSNSISITFQTFTGIDISNIGIFVSSTGQLDIHGAYYNPTWTRLATTAAAGNNWVSLKEAVNWQAGQLVVIPTSIFRDEYNNQNEVMQIKSVSSDGKTLIFTGQLQFSHYGGSEYQTEVALLSRTILLQGWSGSEALSKGPVVTIMGQGRIQGVMGYRMGQKNVNSHYPFHWHHLGTVNGNSYGNDNCVYHSYFRCYVIHGTNNLALVNNVAFHANGNCFYIEDGVEENNWLEHNFGAFVHVIGDPASGPTQLGTTQVQNDSLLQPADSAASVFYSANPNNAWYRNAASGGWSGYSFPVVPSPLGDYRGQSTIIPSSRPLKLFDQNTVHSSGYFWIMAGGIYFGGQLWQDSNGLYYYSSGRYAFDPKDDSGNAVFHTVTNSQAWLAQWGISHWGDRVRVNNWTAVDGTRGANIFGTAQLSNAMINGRSNNVDAQFPGYLWDLDPIAGFRWYDTSVMTALVNVSFSNYVFQPSLGTVRQSVWFSMVQSDEYKPGFISASKGISYSGIQQNALVHHEAIETGSSRYFNFLDSDGSATIRGRPTLVASWPAWWQIGDDCTFYQLYNTWWCDYRPWRTVARLDIRVPGYTSMVNTNSAFAPDPTYYAGYVAQFGYRGSSARNMIVTRNEGITGVTGTGGWYLHLSNGATPYLQIFVTQVPVGTSLMFATRYPKGTQFVITRIHEWYPALSITLTQVYTLQEVLNSIGDMYYFDGNNLYLKIVDPGDASIDPSFTVDDLTITGTRYFNMWYQVNATTLANCGFTAGGRFCSMTDSDSEIPAALNSSYMSWVVPVCMDVAPPTTVMEALLMERAANQSVAIIKSVNSTENSATINSISAAESTIPSAASSVTSSPVSASVSETSMAATQKRSLSSLTFPPISTTLAFPPISFNLGGIFKSPPPPPPPPKKVASSPPPPPFPPPPHKLSPYLSPPSPKSFIPPRPPPPTKSNPSYLAPVSVFCPPPLASLLQYPPPSPLTGNSKPHPPLSSSSGGSSSNDGTTPNTSPGIAVDASTSPGYTESNGSTIVYDPISIASRNVNSYMPDTVNGQFVNKSYTRIAPLLNCTQIKQQGLCGTTAIRYPSDRHAAIIGGYCAATCGVCVKGTKACVDTRAPGGYTCTQRRAWGNCNADWMKSGFYCASTCGYCTPLGASAAAVVPSCTDVRVPPGDYSCADQYSWGKCSYSWMKSNGWCYASCGFCNIAAAATCTDVAPPGGYTCAQQASWGKCTQSFMTSGGYCQKTCGVCVDYSSFVASEYAGGNSTLSGSSASLTAAALIGTTLGGTADYDGYGPPPLRALLNPFDNRTTTVQLQSLPTSVLSHLSDGNNSSVKNNNSEINSSNDNMIITTTANGTSTPVLTVSTVGPENGTTVSYILTNTPLPVQNATEAGLASEADNGTSDSTNPPGKEENTISLTEIGGEHLPWMPEGVVGVDVPVNGSSSLQDVATVLINNATFESLISKGNESTSNETTPTVEAMERAGEGIMEEEVNNLVLSSPPLYLASLSPSSTTNALTSDAINNDSGTNIKKRVLMAEAGESNNPSTTDVSYLKRDNSDGVDNNKRNVLNSSISSNVSYDPSKTVQQQHFDPSEFDHVGSTSLNSQTIVVGMTPSIFSNNETSQPGNGHVDLIPYHQTLAGPTQVTFVNGSSLQPPISNSTSDDGKVNSSDNNYYGDKDQTSSSPLPSLSTTPLTFNASEYESVPPPRLSPPQPITNHSYDSLHPPPLFSPPPPVYSFNLPKWLINTSNHTSNNNTSNHTSNNLSHTETTSNNNLNTNSSSSLSQGSPSSNNNSNNPNKSNNTSKSSSACVLCSDVLPEGSRLTCSALSDWGKCRESWMLSNHYCDITCGRCAWKDTCFDVPPPWNQTCEDVQNSYQCSSAFITAGGWCRKTCGHCVPSAGTAADCVLMECIDVAPPGSIGCTEHRTLGSCDQDWFIKANYCAKTCGRC